MRFSRRSVSGGLSGMALAMLVVRPRAVTSQASERPPSCWLSGSDRQLVRIDPDTLRSIPLGVTCPVRVVQSGVRYLVVEDAQNHWWLVDFDNRSPASIRSTLPAALAAQESLAASVTSWEWHVERSARTDGTMIIVRNQFGDPIIGTSFPRRIEIAVSSISPSRRWTVYIQGNNLVSEVTVIDAARASLWHSWLRHDADLAPYVIVMSFGPGETQALIALLRASNPEPEAWIVDLRHRRSRRIAQDIGFVLAWAGCGTR